MLVWLVSAALAGEPEEGFYAGSYGRIDTSADLEGGGGDAVKVATWGPRLELDPYMELDLGWVQRAEDGARFKVLITPALSGDLFHYDGQWSEALAVRNLFAEASEFTEGAPLSAWAGSRMVRGDDVYLLDFWPLDELNLVGGGVVARPGRAEVAVSVGANRLTGTTWQYQEVVVQEPGSVDGQTVVALDRQRALGTLRMGVEIPAGDVTIRPRLYGEVHALPRGERVEVDPFTEPERVPMASDGGVLIGGQLSAWGWAPSSFVHVWARYASGLAHYGELTIPVDGLDRDYRARDAWSFLAATAGNHETRSFSLAWGAYLYYKVDADGVVVDFDDRWEWVEVVRPQLFATDHLAVGLELSHQHVRPNGLNPQTGTADEPDVVKISLLPAIQIARGAYARPRLHAVYTVSVLDAAARGFWSPSDTRLHGGAQQYVGIGAEWWLDSTRPITPDAAPL